ncbi:HNH endonuclease family protein [Corynebacterium propinquum]|uniref:HNH endonuclease family protein n=1 Tax=Corynebacterium propinquum TaxID=43769 RepID=UPI003CAF0B25
MCAGKKLTGLALAGIVSVFLAGCSDVESAHGDGSHESAVSMATTVSTVSTTVTTTQGAQATDGAEEPSAPTAPSAGKDLKDSFPHAEPGVYTDDSLDYRAMHAALEIKGRAPSSDYDRDLFGQPWSDDVNVAGGHNGCDTRNDILQRDLDEISIRNGTRGCLVESGRLVSPYSGETINFHRGDNQVDIEHVVALGDAWVKGAFQWDETKRRDFANDPINLLAVDASNNRAKGAADAATWLPPHKPFRCDYGRIQVHVKYVYDLWVTEAEHQALRNLLDQC